MSEKKDTDDALRTGGAKLLNRAFEESPVHLTDGEKGVAQKWLATVEHGASVLQPTGAMLAYERSLLGRLLNKTTALDEVASLVRAEHFSDDRTRAIYEGLLAIDRAGRTSDDTGLVEWLCREVGRDTDWFEAFDYLRRCDTGTSTRDKALSVFGAWRNRQLASVCGAAFHRARVAGVFEGEDILNDISDQLAELELPNDAGARDVGIGEAMQTVRDDVAERMLNGNALPGMDTGWDQTNFYLGGWVPGNVIVVKAKTGFGKTAWALSAAVKAAVAALSSGESARSVAVFSMEMEAETIALRVIANMGGVDAMRLRLANLNDVEVEHVVKATRDARSLNDVFRLVYKPALSVGALERIVRRLQRRKGVPPLGLIVVDYLQLLTDPSKKNNREQEVAAISTALINLAKRYRVCVLALSQVNADGAARESRRIEQDADAVILLEPQDPDAKPNDGSVSYDVICHKNRHGITASKGRWRMLFMKALQRFVEMSEQGEQPEDRNTRNDWYSGGNDPAFTPGGSHD